MSYTIRPMTTGDIEEGLAAIKRFLKEERVFGYKNHYFGVDFDRQKMYDYLMRMTGSPAALTLVVTQDGKIVGGFHGTITEYIFSRQRRAVDHLIYFIPPFTSLPAVREIIAQYTEWATKCGAREAMLSSSTGFKEDLFGLLAQRAGFQLTACGYTKELD